MLWEEELRESYRLVAEDRREDTTANTPALYVREKGAELWTSLHGGGGEGRGFPCLWQSFYLSPAW